MTYGIILAAGNQSRFNDTKPKALSDYKGRCLLDHNIDELMTVCEKVYVVCSYNNEHYFDNYNKVVIESGYGSGDAVFSALEKISPKFRDRCIIQWGDSIAHDNVISRTFDYKELGVYGVVVPCVYEENPYVKLEKTSDTTISVKFSKFGEVTGPGYHDISIFYCNAFKLYHYLRIFRSNIINVLDKTDNPNKYNFPEHDNEMEFLDVFNMTDMATKLEILDDYKDLSFNTKEELEQLNKE